MRSHVAISLLHYSHERWRSGEQSNTLPLFLWHVGIWHERDATTEAPTDEEKSDTEWEKMEMEVEGIARRVRCRAECSIK